MQFMINQLYFWSKKSQFWFNDFSACRLRVRVLLLALVSSKLIKENQPEEISWEFPIRLE